MLKLDLISVTILSSRTCWKMTKMKVGTLSAEAGFNICHTDRDGWIPLRGTGTATGIISKSTVFYRFIP